MEQEIHMFMLMIILKEELVVKQRTFKQMKNCIVENQSLFGQREL